MSEKPYKSDLAKLDLSIPLAANVCTKAAAAYIVLQAHSDALGSWGDNGAAARRAWEGDGRIDLRSVTNCLRQLPYHVAWQKGFRQAAGVLNPTVPIDSALETCRELGEGQHTLSLPNYRLPDRVLLICHLIAFAIPGIMCVVLSKVFHRAIDFWLASCWFPACIKCAT